MFKSRFVAATAFSAMLSGAGEMVLADDAIEPPVHDSIVLMTENLPPYNMAVDGKNFAQESNIDGIAAEVLRDTFKRAGIGYSMTLRFPWERIYKLAMEKPGYGVFSTARLPEREKLFKWVGPLGSYDWVMLARADSPITLKSLEQAGSYRIGAYKGDAVGERLVAQGLNPILMLRDQDNAKKLVNGQIDLWAAGDPTGPYLARLEGVTGLKTVLRFHHAELYLALNRTTPDEVVNRLQAALDQLRAEGAVERILARYR
jgi:polar amino acid transport system substrate-binding protein